MKIITTAIFTVTLLGRVLNRKQWLSVFGVFCGVVMVQVAPQVTLKTTVSVGKVLSNVATTRDSLRGLLCLLGSCVLSGFAGVYTEKVLSKSSSSIFASCLQMSLCSVVPAAVPVIVALGRSIALLGGSETATDGLFVAFGVWAWIAVLYNVWGGFTVAITMKIASSLAKSLATSVAVVLTFLISIFWLHETMAFLRIMGAFVVVSSVYVYSNAATPPSISIIEGIASTELECEMSQLDISIGSSIDSSRGGNGHPSP
jgi:UDP-sugar transporter A1/2/3